jgi:uroporphyrinogen III methyltransferase/synthase
MENADELIKALEDKTIDVITFTSSSTVKNFKELLPADRFAQLIDGVKVASIGPITAETAKELGFEVHIIADIFTIPGLCEAILKYYGK